MRKRCLAGQVNSTGILYVAALPLGNLQDVTIRVLQKAAEVDYILAEDTRTAARFFEQFDLKPVLRSYHEHSSDQKREDIIKDLSDGRQIMLTAEAGTPTISDPGYQLVKEARQKQITVLPLPGASAVICALSVSGFPTDCFFFAGFLSKKQKKIEQLEELFSKETTVVFYESPHRIIETLTQMNQIDDQREVFVAREMTKMYEEYLWGSSKELLALLSSRPKIRGEFVVIIKGEQQNSALSVMQQLVIQLLDKELSDKDIVDIVSRTYAVKRNVVRQIISEYVKM